jgi:hypothetical protein
MLNMGRIEKAVMAVVWALVLLGLYLSYADPDYFRNQYTVEDGLLEWATVAALVTAMIVCGKRLFLLWNVRKPRFRAMVCFLALACLFGAGEEISWGQRLFGFTSPAYFAERNSQQEVGLHNLKVNIDGRSIKLNKLIFGVGLALSMSIYLFVMTPLYRKHSGFADWLDSMAIPMPRNYQLISYLLLIVVVELLIDSSKRGEITEFAGSFIFMLNVVFPYNQRCFDR